DGKGRRLECSRSGSGETLAEAGDASRHQSETAAEKYRAGPAIAPLGHAAGRKRVRDHCQNGRLICACSHGERGRKFAKMTSAVATQFLPGVATASATRDFLVASIHDVAPSTQAIAEKIISSLASK